MDYLKLGVPAVGLCSNTITREQAVKAARLQAIAPYGSATSRKRHLAWKAAEAAFAASIARLVG